MATFSSLATMVMRLSLATILLKFSIRPVLLIALTSSGVVALATPFADNYPFIALLKFLIGLNYGAVMSFGSTLIATHSTPDADGFWSVTASWDGDFTHDGASSSLKSFTVKKSGCLIATATYGSELSPQVQFLRGFRDNTVYSIFAGSNFMTAFKMVFTTHSVQM